MGAEVGVAVLFGRWYIATIMVACREDGMSSITIKNVPADLCRRLKRAASEHRRSVNSEVIETLSRSLAPATVSADEFLARARSLRQRIRVVAPDVSALGRMRMEGRA